MSDIYKTAEVNTRWQPAYFLIYDASTPTECNRLVKIMPFEWYVWATKGRVFVLENTLGNICPLGTLPALQVTPDPETFVHICLSVTLDGIMTLYGGIPHKVFYDITQSAVPNKFTVLDCLNILFDGYITITFEKWTTDIHDDMYKIKENSTIKKYEIAKILKRHEELTPKLLEDLQRRVHNRQLHNNKL